MQVLDDGNVRWSTSTLSRVGDAVVKILQNPEETKNQIVYIQSFCVSQNQVIESLNRASGHRFAVSHINSQDALDDLKNRRDDGDPDAIEGTISILGMTRANWEAKLANRLIGLPDESMDETIKRVYSSVVCQP